MSRYSTIGFLAPHPCPTCPEHRRNIRRHDWPVCAQCMGTPSFVWRARPPATGRHSVGNIAAQIARWLLRATRTAAELCDVWRMSVADSLPLVAASAWLKVDELEAFVHVVIPLRVRPRWKGMGTPKTGRPRTCTRIERHPAGGWAVVAPDGRVLVGGFASRDQARAAA